MKSGRSIQDIAAEIARRSRAKKDFLVPTTKVEMVASQQGPALVFADQQIAVNDLAHEQIGLHVDIPKRYYDKMRREAPHLLASNVNEWFRKYPATRTIRTLDDKARAFLSDKYRPLENEELAEAVLPVIADIGLDVMSCEITDKRFYLKVVDQRVTKELEAKGGKFGDGKHVIVRCLSPALTISNSEVGYGALSVLGSVYDSFCSNLASFGERSTRKYHIGAKHELAGEDIYALLSDSTRKVTDAALWAQVGDIVRAAFDRAKFDALCDKISETEQDKIEGDVVKAVTLTSKRFGLNETENGSVLKHLIEGGSLTRFGIYNAVTRASQDVEDYDRATEMEAMGGKIIELAREDWKAIALAA